MLNQPIPFELHITTTDLHQNQIGSFVEVCSLNGGKPLLIELSQGEYTRQPMFNKVILVNEVEEAIKSAFDYAQVLNASGFQTTRVKIEIPSNCVKLVQESQETAFEPYFEWHGKILFNRVNQLLELCAIHKAHLSKNALKDDNTTRFITLRELGTKEVLEQRIDRLTNDFAKDGWDILKQQSEYCLYDTNMILDQGWLPQ